MKKILADVKIIEKFKDDVQGVFTLSDLKSIFPLNDPIKFYRRLKTMESAGVLRRAVRKIYITDNFDLKRLSQEINPETYISFENVLAESLVIGTIPSKQIKAVKVGKRREYEIGDYKIIHAGIKKELYFGFTRKNGIQIADKEKAFLDTLYFYLKGYTYYFDIYSDIDTSRLDVLLIKKYLENYGNPKFIRFVRSFLS